VQDFAHAIAHGPLEAFADSFDDAAPQNGVAHTLAKLVDLLLASVPAPLIIAGTTRLGGAPGFPNDLDRGR
jgi:hypothetical protein